MARFSKKSDWFETNNAIIADTELPKNVMIRLMEANPSKLIMENNVRVYRTNAYEIRESLKAAGYRFNDNFAPKAWYKDFKSLEAAFKAIFI